MSRKHQEKLKKPSGFSETFIQRSDNFETSALPDHDKRKTHVQADIEGKYIAITKYGDQYLPAPLSLSNPKTAPILKGLNRMPATEKAGLIKLFEVAYLTALKGRPFSHFTSFLEFEKIHGVKFLEKYEHRNSCREFIDYTSDYFSIKTL